MTILTFLKTIVYHFFTIPYNLFDIFPVFPVGDTRLLSDIWVISEKYHVCAEKDCSLS